MPKQVRTHNKKMKSITENTMISETSKIMRLYDSKGKIIIPILIMTALLFVASDVYRSLVPASIRNPILEENSVEQSLLHI